MASPYPHGSSAYPDPTSPAGSSTPSSSSRTRYSQSQAQPNSEGPSNNFYSQPHRSPLINPSGDLDIRSGSRGSGDFARGEPDDMDNSTFTNVPRTWRRSGGLPSFSRAFAGLISQDGTGDASQDNVFFTPSYLQKSAYVQKLQEAHRSQLLSPGSPQAALSRAGNKSPFSQHPPQGSHRGMSHSVIERSVPSGEDEALAPLPSKWSKNDQSTGVEILPDGLSVKFVGSKSQHETQSHEACAVRANHFMPPQCGIYYYEVHILSSKRDDTTVGIGFSMSSAMLSRPVGWEPDAWGYHGDDGRCFTGQNNGRVFGSRYNAEDVIGCGVNFRTNAAFFTRNGFLIGTPFQDIKRTGKLYPTISLKKPGEYVKANFGQAPFVFNIDGLMSMEQQNATRDLAATDTSSLAPGLKETDLIQTLVLQFLQHDGYVDTARAFAEDMRVQKEALNLDPDVTVDCINIKDDEDAENRQKIRRAILEGDIDRALKYTNAYYPSVLRDNEEVHFHLRCRKFIEMVRKAAQVKMANDTQDTDTQEMEMDFNGSDNLAVALGSESQPGVLELERTMLHYGQSLQAEYANDQRKEVTRVLRDIWSLVAYKNPLKEPQVSHLLDRNGRVAVAEELNSAILMSLGKSSRASLETIYAQTSVLLEDLRQDGGQGAFISIQDVISEIPSPPQL